MLKDRTKGLLAAELEPVLAGMPLSRARVNALCGRCGARTLSAQRLFDIELHSYGSVGVTAEWPRGVEGGRRRGAGVRLGRAG